MHKLYELKEKLMRELEDYSENGKFSKEDVEAIKYITSIIELACKIPADHRCPRIPAAVCDLTKNN